MGLIVQKFGGTSVATEMSRKAIYNKIKKAKEEGNDLVVVVSAMGRRGEPYATDSILDLIRNKYTKYDVRELDMAFVCGEMISAAVITSYLKDMGLKAIALNGQQAGILADNNHFNASIISIDTKRINKHLLEGNIVVVTGGQAINSNNDFTSLGRGGSDTSAVALGNALGAYETIIYTDVVGIMSTDPRIIKEAKIIKQISFDHCLKLAEEGATVIHPRAVKESILHPEIKLYVRSTFSDDLGTYVGEMSTQLIPQVVGITKIKMTSDKSKDVKITLVGSHINSLEKQILRIINENQIDIEEIEFHDSFASLLIEETNTNKVISLLHNEFIA
ncbi:MAG: aspartate kinase [Tissierellales bacterium]|nr:aspartate kinase [Tissierellales bacterium]